MRRPDFEHVIAAAAEVSGERELVVIGSQAILGPYPNAPLALLGSIEVDIYPRHAPEQSVEIDGVLGEGSQFMRTFGYYAHGVGPETAKAPAGWELRLIEVHIESRPGSTESAVAWCLEPHDLVLSKCAAGREKDWEFAKEALAAGLVDPAELQQRAGDLPLDEPGIATVRRQLVAMAAAPHSDQSRQCDDG